MIKTQISPRDLADEFSTSPQLMQEFLNKFSPTHVAKNQYYATADTMLFIHIPKTAGISLGKTLTEVFDQFHSVQWNDIQTSFRNATRNAVYEESKGSIRQVIMGHFGWREMQIWINHEMPMKCGTIFRDPISRAVSNYNYNCSESHPHHTKFKSKYPSLSDFVLDIPTDVQLTQAIGMTNSFEVTLKKLIKHYSFIGVTEQLSASINHLSKSHGLNRLNEYRRNIGPKINAQEIPAELKKHIINKSHNDSKIHRLMMKIYENTDE